jgi:hypothetical protein
MTIRHELAEMTATNRTFDLIAMVEKSRRFQEDLTETYQPWAGQCVNEQLNDFLYHKPKKAKNSQK